MEQLAFIKQHHLFQRLSEMTEYAALNNEQRRVYDADLKAYRDLTNSFEFLRLATALSYICISVSYICRRE